MYRYTRHKNGQTQGKGSREKSEEKGKAAEEFGKHPHQADGHRYSIFLFPVGQDGIQTPAVKPTENLLRRVGKERDGETQAQDCERNRWSCLKNPIHLLPP